MTTRVHRISKTYATTCRDKLNTIKQLTTTQRRKAKLEKGLREGMVVSGMGQKGIIGKKEKE